MTEKLTRPQAVALAREMWEDGNGWSITEIRAYLAERGQQVAWPTVKHWVDEDWHEQRLARRRQLERSPTAAPSPPELLWALRMEDRLTYPTIAKVAARFLGESMSESQVKRRLSAMGAPKNPNRVRAALERNQMRRAA